MRSRLFFALFGLPCAVMAQDFSWINTEFSEVLSYQAMHFSECTSFAETICRPTAAACASALCANCPKYYDTCCLQTTTAPADCFQSIAAGEGNAQAPASATAPATTSSGNDGVSGAQATVGGSPVSSSPTPTSKNFASRPTHKAKAVVVPLAMAAALLG